MATLVAHLPATPEWEVKNALALHQWQGAEHVEWLRNRIGEMRHPIPPLDAAPDAALDRFLEEMLRAASTLELLVGCYRVARATLIDAYEEHERTTNPLVDHPTRRLLQFALMEHRDAMRWAIQAIAALVERDPNAALRTEAWERHLRAYLAAAGGVAGPAPDRVDPLPPARAAQPFMPDLHPKRDDRFHGQYWFDFPPHVVYNDPTVPADERNLALLCKRTLEMDVPEMMASVMVERPAAPWEFHRDYARQLWDEMRHAMMGTVAFETRGVDWTQIPLNVGFALRLNLHATPLERQTILYAIEQSLMPAPTGKRFEFETAQAAGDPLSAHFHDYDWADEVLHAQIGRRLLRAEGITSEEATRQAHEIHERTWAALDRYRGPEDPPDWWDELCRAVLGKPSALAPAQRGALKILSE
jgi:hypothetical protein